MITVCAPTHALNHLLLPATNCAISLRTRGHSCQLPEYSERENSSSLYSLQINYFVDKYRISTLSRLTLLPMSASSPVHYGQHLSCRSAVRRPSESVAGPILLIFIRKLFLSVVYIARQVKFCFFLLCIACHSDFAFYVYYLMCVSRI